ncbi:hypothetical protein CLOM_g880 [Closterium sp. NIES-68]|nr:hypothetical protein CLOM_g880 [Closterium sp. NIES-68]GJP65932.1 hypothetical protein CLOP_g22828 [Closterium sp. NIES-67]
MQTTPSPPHLGATDDRMAGDAAAATAATPEPVTRREEWGWYLYDAAVSAFYSVALPVFFPLLLNQLATDAAWQQAGQPRPPDCDSDGGGTGGGGVAVDCAQCVAGEGMQLLTSAGYSPLPNPKVHLWGGAGIDPVAFATVTLGLSVVCQVIAFVTLGPLADYGMGRMRLLQGGTAVGITACALCMALVSPSLWWLSGVLLIVANVGYGLAIVAYYSFLPVLVDASPPVLKEAQRAVEALAAQASDAGATMAGRAEAAFESAQKEELAAQASYAGATMGGGLEPGKGAEAGGEAGLAAEGASGEDGQVLTGVGLLVHAGMEGSPESYVAVGSCGGHTDDLQTPLLVARDQEENRMSLTGVACASIASILATLLAFAATLPVASDALKLRLAMLACALWWLLLSFPTFLWLHPRPGPPFPPLPLPLSSTSSSRRSCHQLCALLSSLFSSAFSGWRHMGKLFAEARRYRNAFAFLLCYFVYADGYTTILQIGILFGERDLCVPTTTLVFLAICVSVAATLCTPLLFYLQRALHPVLTNKRMVMLMLAGMLPLPLWGLLGYLTGPQTVGLKAPWELFVFACWFGFFLGGLNAYSRTLFIDMIPVGREAAFFSLYSVSDKGSSWLGPFIVAIIVQVTGQIRPSFLYVFLVILIPLVCLHFFVNHKQGIVDAGRTTHQLHQMPIHNDENGGQFMS